MNAPAPVAHLQPKVERIRALIELRQYHTAEKECRFALVEEPGSAEILRLLAFTLHKQGKRKDALMAVRDSLAADPREYRTHYLQALVLADDPRDHSAFTLAAASAAARQALDLAPTEPDCFGILAWLQNLSRQPAEASATAGRGLAFDPEHENCLLQQVQALQARGKWQESEKFVAILLAVNPTLPAAHSVGGDQAMAAGKFKTAEDLYKGAGALNPLNAAYRAGYVAARSAQMPAVAFANKLKASVRKHRLVALLLVLGLLGLAQFLPVAHGENGATWIVVLGFWIFVIGKIYHVAISVVLVLKDPLYRLCLTPRQQRDVWALLGIVHLIGGVCLMDAVGALDSTAPRFPLLLVAIPFVPALGRILGRGLRTRKSRVIVSTAAGGLMLVGVGIALCQFTTGSVVATPSAEAIIPAAALLWVLGVTINNVFAIWLAARGRRPA